MIEIALWAWVIGTLGTRLAFEVHANEKQKQVIKDAGELVVWVSAAAWPIFMVAKIMSLLTGL